MTDSEFSQLESYLFSEKKEEFIQKLITGTDSFYYFTLMNALNTYGIQLSKQHEQYLENYKKFNTAKSRNIKLRSYFLQLDKATT
jgi:hypothetical protein